MEKDIGVVIKDLVEYYFERINYYMKQRKGKGINQGDMCWQTNRKDKMVEDRNPFGVFYTCKKEHN